MQSLFSGTTDTFSSVFCTLIMLWLGAYLFEVEGANAREISVSNSPVVNERHAELLRSVDGHLTACHQQHSLPRRARHLDRIATHVTQLNSTHLPVRNYC